MTDLFGSVEKQEFMDGLLRGEKGDCPCCGRYAQVYRRQISSATARQFIKLYRMTGASRVWVRSSELLFEGSCGVGDFSKGKYWDLVEEKPHEPDATRNSAYWRFTQRGLLFVQGQACIQKYALVFDDQVIKFEGDMVGIKECLTEKFNYAELMAA